DAISVHGGSGFIMEYKSQRLYRDARIFSIYEGTTQLQTVAALRYITNGTYLSIIKEYEAENEPLVAGNAEYAAYLTRIKEMAAKLEEAINAVKAAESQELLDFCSRKLYEITAYTIMCHLILADAVKAPELFGKSLNVFVNHAESEIARHLNYVQRITVEQLENYKQNNEE
ncbi:MAG: acyl-CoA dehydrogenase, partial [Bacteroidaceae bacterium]|nr:acyl-CoA dehydrogenase [Bacteroidaceae bacterium]